MSLEQINAMPQNTKKELEAKIAALKAYTVEVGKQERSTISLKVSEKKAVSLYGLGPFPVTLYSGQWERLIEAIPQVKAFIETHKAELATKEAKVEAGVSA